MVFSVVSIGAAVASLVFAVFTWWWSHLSRKARQEAERARLAAETAEQNARDELAAVRSVAASLETLKKPRLGLVWISRNEFMLENNTDTDMRVEVLNNSEFPWIRHGVPKVIPARSSRSAKFALNGPHRPQKLRLRLEGSEETTFDLAGRRAK
jgi:hypothetical protein